MGYLHIDNLYKNQSILMFKECYALEKIHGTSAHLSFRKVQLAAEMNVFSGGEKHDRFAALFDRPGLVEKFMALNVEGLVIFGEAYGGKQQGMSATYGPDLKFVVFDVRIDDMWLDVPKAAEIARTFGLEFVPYERVSTDLAVLDVHRDLPSRQAARNGITTSPPAEGIVLRPLIELTTNNGGRIICKHKRGEFSERKSKKDTAVDPVQQEVLAAAEAIAEEWVTPMRVTHVADKLQATKGSKLEMSDTGAFVLAMVEDVYREGRGELVESRAASKAIGSTARQLFHKMLQSIPG